MINTQCVKLLYFQTGYGVVATNEHNLA